jgi:hypothetical protein
MAFRLLLGEALQLEKTEKLHSHTYPSGPRTQEEDSMRCQRLTGSSRGELGGIQETRQNYSAGALDIVVKDWVTVPEGV